MTEIRAFAGFSGRRRDGTLIKGLVPQFDGSTFAGDNCAGASEAGRCIRNQHGVRPAKGAPWQPTGHSVRLATGDTSGGMTAHQTTRATKDVYAIPNDVRVVDWSEAVAWLRKGGSLVALIRYRPISAAGLSGSPGFYGNHSVEFIGVRGSGSNIEILVADPTYDGRKAGIPKGPQWIRIGVLKQAARELVLDVKTKVTVAMRYGLNALYASFGTRAFTPPVPTVPFRLYPGAIRLKKSRVYTPTRKLYMRKSPKLVSTNRITTVGPGFAFEAYQYGHFGGIKWVGNKTGTAWIRFDSLKFVRYL
jgi:hypothetical protein